MFNKGMKTKNNYSSRKCNYKVIQAINVYSCYITLKQIYNIII
jgi:hypothetical protein